jgi:hypothetical protein
MSLSEKCMKHAAGREAPLRRDAISRRVLVVQICQIPSLAVKTKVETERNRSGQRKGGKGGIRGQLSGANLDNKDHDGQKVYDEKKFRKRGAFVSHFDDEVLFAKLGELLRA